MDVTSVTLIRHGTTLWSASGQHTSKTDIGLTEEGEQEAQQLGRFLPREHYGAVFSSTLRRAHDTAILAGFPNAGLDADLCEWQYGAYEGKTTAEIHQHDPQWSLFRCGAPGGETPDEVTRRCDHLLAKWAHSGHAHILCFSHGHLLRAVAARWMGQDIGLGDHLNLGPCIISRLAWEHHERALSMWNHCPCATPNG